MRCRCSRLRVLHALGRCAAGILALASVSPAAAGETSPPGPGVAGAEETRSAVSLEAPRWPRARLSGALGTAMSIGEAARDLKMRDVMPTPILLGVDAAWAPVPSFDIGITSLAMIGLGTPTHCPEPTATCGLAAGGFGLVRGHYHFRPLATFNPWLGVGVGIEVVGSNGQTTESDLNLINTSTTTEITEFYFGPVFGAFQAGFDYRLKQRLFLGASLDFAVARYTSMKRTTKVDGRETSSSSAGLEGATHEWLMLTMHLTFDIAL